MTEDRVELVARDAFEQAQRAPYRAQLEPCPISFERSGTGQMYRVASVERDWQIFASGFRAALDQADAAVSEAVTPEQVEAVSIAEALLGHFRRHGYKDDTFINETVGFTAGDLRTLLAMRAVAPASDATADGDAVPREPTEAMIEAGANTPGMKAANSAMSMHQARGYGFVAGAFEDGSPLHQAWRAMYDAARGDQSPDGGGDGNGPR